MALTRLKINFALRLSAGFLWSVLMVLLAITLVLVVNEKPQSTVTERKTIAKLLWTDVDFKNPPMTENFLQETVRINELIAHEQLSCENLLTLQLNVSSIVSPLCVSISNKFRKNYSYLPTGNVKKSRFIRVVSVLSQWEDLEFEKKLSITYPAAEITVISSLREPFQKHLPHALAPQTGGRKNGKFSNIRAVLAAFDPPPELKVRKIKVKDVVRMGNIKKIDLLKLDCPEYCTNPFVLQTIVSEFFQQNITIKQMHLQIKISERYGVNYVYGWYQLIHRLYYDHNMAVFKAMQIGHCGRNIMNCQYKLSFVKFPIDGTVSALSPLMGLGMPAEEFNRLKNYLAISTPDYDCNKLDFVTVSEKNGFPICSDSFKSDNCYIYLFTYGQSTVNFTSLAVSRLSCELHVFDPAFDSSETLNRENVHKFHGWGLAPEDKQTESAPGLTIDSKFWELRSLNNTMHSLHHFRVDAIILDLNGGEWDVLDSLLSSGILTRSVNNLIINIRLWYGEEFENYRDQFTWMLRLRAAGFRKFMAKAKREDCPIDSCYQIGWTNIGIMNG